MANEYYVTMTDKALSGWGCAKDKINKLIFICKDYNEALIVSNNAENRTDMRYINICVKKPYYNKDRYFTQIKDISIYPNWYRSGAFKVE